MNKWVNEWCLRAQFCTVTKPETTWANEMNFGMNHAPGAGLITHFNFPFNLLTYLP